jgi:DUF1009 family protein
MKRAGATALSIDAERTLLLDRAKLLELADASGIAIQAIAAPKNEEPGAEFPGMNNE